jgi:hypothetical protein
VEVGQEGVVVIEEPPLRASFQRRGKGSGHLRGTGLNEVKYE